MTTTVQSPPALSIHQLPPEILIQIFKEIAALDASDKETPPSSLFTCSQVDRRWNAIASAPTLYTEILVPFQALRERGYDTGKWARSWLERSGPHLVDIDIQVHGEIYHEIYHFYDLLRSLLPYISKIRTFSVTVFDELTVDLSLFFHPFKYVDAPALEEIMIHHTKKADNSELRVSMRNEPLAWSQLFWSTPGLRRVRFLGAVAERPLENLTVIEMRNVVLDERVVRKIASSCPDLQELTLHQLHLPSPDTVASAMGSESDEQIPMLSLRSLNLGFDFEASADFIDARYRCVLTRIEAPNLELLELDGAKLLVGITNVLPRPSSLPGLRKIILRNLGDRLFFEKGYVKELRTSRIEEIALVNTLPDPLGIDSSASKRDFSELKTLSMDTDDPKDLIWLCQAIISRPQIETLNLSRRALKQLQENILMLHLDQNLTWVGIRSEHGDAAHTAVCEDEGIYDKAEEWISKWVVLKVV